ncbi:MAG: efflux RND transporter periplasmic adaptor subunit [Pseudomonadota bacterium]
MTSTDKSIAVIVVLGIVSVAVTVFLFIGKPSPKRTDRTAFVPPVEVMLTKSEDLTLSVAAQGSVSPRRQIDLVTQVSGRVVKIDNDMFAGEFFSAGQTLIWIDERDYVNALKRAEADVASARQRLALEQAEADQAARDWELLGGEGAPSELVLRKPQLAEAQAQLDAARATLADAKLSLERTRISVPFAGRVREKAVDVGQFVNVGQRLGTIYSTDMVEIRLPLTDREASYLNLPLSPKQDIEPVPVTVSATFTGQKVTWDGIIRRTDGAIDPRSRVLVAIAEVEDPFNLMAGADPKAVPLSVGLFVSADIRGKRYRNVVKIPRTALRSTGDVITVDAASKLHFKSVEVLRTTPEYAIIARGLNAGEQLLITKLDAPIEGMNVNVTNASSGASQSNGAVSVAVGGGL